MEVYTSYTKEFSHESSLQWTIKNLKEIDLKKCFVMKSKEVNFADAKTRWHLKLTPFVTSGVYLVFKFVVKMLQSDENARFRFDITFSGMRFLNFFHLQIY